MPCRARREPKVNHDLLERVLSCPELPSLPAVALRVIEMTADPHVKLSELAAVIQNDQGLAAKILRTVNSSYYALRQPCSTINKALVMLGLGPVKSLALGFSLVSSVNTNKDANFDYEAYWRRGLYSAVAAKAVADAARKPWADEAFLAGLLQDLGVMALLKSLKQRYTTVVAKTNGDHRRLTRVELADLEVQHPDIGAMLAERWKLPPELVLPVRYHERPTAAPKDHGDICRCVGVANTIHDVLTDASPAASLKLAYDRCKQWFDLDTTSVDAVLRRVGDGVKELSRLFQLDTGDYSDTEAILLAARERQLAISAQSLATSEPDAETGMGGLLMSSAGIDPLTGTLARSEFDKTVREAMIEGFGTGGETTLAQICVESHRKLCASKGIEAGDDVLVRTAASLSKRASRIGGKVCRVGTDVFALVAPVEMAKVASAIDAFRADLCTVSIGGELITVRVGCASAKSGVADGPRDAVELVVAATRAMQTARVRDVSAAA